MKNEKYEKILIKQFEGIYSTSKELEYSKEVGTFLSPFEYQEYLKYKEDRAMDNDGYLTLLPLKAFNHKCLYYCFGNELKAILESYYSFLSSESSFLNKFSKSFNESRIYSEIEGTLNVENVPTTRRRLKELLEEDAPVKDKNDIIIKNMKAGIDFVNELPDFNKDNLFALYSILSKDCLDDDDVLKPGDYYRYDGVEIAHYHGCPCQLIDECMNSLFEYVNDVLYGKNKNMVELTLLPHICHYYMIYIHPYFDYNGRTARMVSYWIYLLSGVHDYPPIVSEAINQTKNKYYNAIELSRDSHNDLTYFLKYIFGITCDYAITYQNLEYIEKANKNKGIIVTETELNYMKKILISYDGAFSYFDFLKKCDIDMSKQGALKILNKFIDYGFLIEIKNKSKTKIFDINKDNIPYLLKSFGYKANTK